MGFQRLEDERREAFEDLSFERGCETALSLVWTSDTLSAPEQSVIEPDLE